MKIYKLSCQLIILILISASGSHALASQYLQLSSQNSSTSPFITQSSVELNLSTESHSEKKNLYYDVNINVTQGTTPTTFQLTPISVNGATRYIAPFSTTLTSTNGTFSMDWHHPSNWQYGFEYNYSVQTGAGTPNTTSSIWNLNLGRKIEYHNETENADFKPSYAWKVKAGTGSISAGNFIINDTTLKGTNPSTDPIPAASLIQSDLALELTWDLRIWITLNGSYEQFGYDSDPNLLAPAKSPKRGSATSLENFEDMISLTFHLNDSWDFEVRGTYDVTATADQSSSDEETYTLTYIADNFEIGLGYDHMNSSGLPTDSSVVIFKIDF